MLTPATGLATSATSGWALRRAMEASGRGVSDQQLDTFTAWGLLERDGDGYAAGSEERLAVILDAAEEARSLPRRVVRLRADAARFPVPAEPLQRAFIHLAPTIRRPIRKLQSVASAWAAMGEASMRVALRGKRSGRLPSADTWPGLIANIPPGRFEAHVTSWYRLAVDVLPLYAEEIGLDLNAIPIEERVVMVAVLASHGLASP